ncbi:hypothetical protein MTR67_013548 [Solanum verrucosum]|uniref:Uncharacterized protein n=1 Tax=Solanum verrucosum TaxID=315347 RepID=A0AAF0QCQ4_SOLVR|nr:hypothetical protein MTR67_013548 [Solanum verrucosum]
MLDANSGYLCLHHTKMYTKWYQYIKCTSM